MNGDPFQSHLISTILTWLFSIPLIIGLLVAAIGMLFEKQEGVPRIFLIWLIICMLLFSPLRYILLQLFTAIAFPFQSIPGLLSTFLLAIYIPIVFGLLYALGLGLPFILLILVAGKKDPPSKGRLLLSAVVAPLIFLIGSFLYYNVLPYAAYSTHWVGTKEIIRTTNGPSKYFYKYVVEQFTPLEFPKFVHDMGFDKLSSKERFRAHVAAVYLGKKEFAYYVYKAYPKYNETSSRTAYWTDEIKRDIIAGIKGDKPLPGFTEEQMTEYGNFVLKRIMQEYPNPEKMPDRLPDEFVLKVQREYYNKYRND